MIDVLTVSSPLSLGAVRTLAESVAEFLPGARFHWLVTGEWEPKLESKLGALGEVTALGRFSAAGREARAPGGAGEVGPRLRLPAAALELLRRPDCDGVRIFAPRVALYSPLPELAAGGLKADVVLAPVLVRPQPVTSPAPPAGELRALRYGVFSDSVVGVAPTAEGERFLRWWGERAREFVPPPDDYHRLRPWLNLAPALFAGVGVLRSPRFGVGRDNLHERRLEGDIGDGVMVDGEPLGFFDFAGVDDGSLAAAIRDGRGDRSTLESIVYDYRRRLDRDAETGAEPLDLGNDAGPRP